MSFSLRHPMGLATAALALAALAGCSPTSFGRSAPPPPPPVQPAAIAPVQTSAVQSSELPPIGGSTSVAPAVPANTAGTQTVASTPGFLLDDIGGPGNTTGGRDLSGALTMEQLLGGWTVMAGAQQCRLNLTYTAKGSTGRYRASTPACNEPTLALVTSWQLLGNQIQLYNEADTLVGTLLRSGNRFVGTLAGGQAISMVG